MAKNPPPKTAPKKTTRPRLAGPPRPTLSFSRVNAIWLGVGVVSIAIGYGLLSAGSTTPAAVLLVLGYCVFLPIGIIKR